MPRWKIFRIYRLLPCKVDEEIQAIVDSTKLPAVKHPFLLAMPKFYHRFSHAALLQFRLPDLLKSKVKEKSLMN